MSAANILIVDDELVICKSCEKIFLRAGHKVTYCTSGKQGLEILERETFDVVFTDLKMMDIGGLEVVQTVKQKFPETVVVVITGYATIASAVETMRSGAFDYLPKPFTPNELLTVLHRALERRSLIQSVKDAPLMTFEKGFEGFIGKCPAIQEVFHLVSKVAPTDSTVLIIGESGTGKDLTAKAIHNNSRRSGEKFFAIDLTTLQSTLLESELFGHVKGAFTGAAGDKPGVFEVADRGTIFLDEIGNLPVETQARLLRVLQEKEILPVGGTAVKKVDVRLIFATNKNLKDLVGEGKFREDLYYRLNVFPIKLPPLRERREDIPDLVSHFLQKYSVSLKRNKPVITPEALELLLDHSWPGNVRELEHTIERLCIMVEGDTITPPHISEVLFRSDVNVPSAIPKTLEELNNLKKHIRSLAIHDIEKQFIEESLKRNNWNISQAAREVNMQRSNFQALMKKHRIKRPPYIS